MDNPAVGIDHYENFPVASVLCPPRLRAPILAIYRFARTADDLADEGAASMAQRLEGLHRYRAALHLAAHNGPTDEWPEVFGPLAQSLRTFALPLPLLHDLLDAFEQDCANPLYADRQQLLDYCRRSANPVGRLLLHLHGVADAASLMRSDAICSALQLINFWQDASVDLARGRNYFPLHDLQRHGLQPADLHPGGDTPATQALLRELSEWARALMLQGSGLALQLPGRVGWELRLVVQGGLRILARIDAMQHRTLAQRPTLSRADWLAALWRALRMSGAPPSGQAGT